MEVTIDFDNSSTQGTFEQEHVVTVSGTLSDRSFSGDAEVSIVPTTETGNDILTDNDIPPEKETVSVVNGQFHNTNTTPNGPRI